MKALRLWLPAIVWMIVIFLLSSRQSVSVSPDYWLNFLFFKTLHVVEYAILFILYTRGLGGRFSYAFLLTILYAVTDEIHQTAVPTREGRVRDVIIDGIGAGIAWISMVTLLPKGPKKLKKWGRHWLVRGQR